MATLTRGKKKAKPKEVAPVVNAAGSARSIEIVRGFVVHQGRLAEQNSLDEAERAAERLRAGTRRRVL